jgi:hypothetical protein
MELVTDAVKLLNQLAIAVILTVVLILISDPSAVGHWLAQVDIAYDSIWGEYVADCDCTLPLE